MSLYICPSAARVLARTAMQSLWPATYMSESARLYLSSEKPSMAWNLLWVYPLNLIGSAISLALELVAIAVSLVAAPILAIVGAATQNTRIRGQRLQSATAMALLAATLTNIFFLTTINILCPGVYLHKAYKDTTKSITGLVINVPSSSRSSSSSSLSDLSDNVSL